MNANTDLLVQRMAELGCEDIKVVGDEVWCRCPFHDDTNPSFSANVEKGANCFSCSKGKFHSVDDFLKVLSGIKKKPFKPIEPDPDSLQAMFDKMVARQEVEEVAPQPLDPRILNFFDVDYQYFLDHESWNVSLEVCKRRNLLLDRMDRSQCFPIRDREQNLWGVVRRMDGEERSIYRYPKGFNKKSILLGEDCPAREGICSVWVVEGITDICAVDTWSGGTAVALGGAHASDEQIRRLLSYDSVTLCLDDDEAGWEGTRRLLEHLPPDDLYVAEYDGSDPGKSKKFRRYPAYEFV